MSGRHLNEATLLRLVVSDLSLEERQPAERHLRRCKSCRLALKASGRLDGALRAAGGTLADAAEDSGTLPATDPFAARPASKIGSAAEAGFDPRALAREAADALPEARDLGRRLVSALSKDERQTHMSSLDFDVLRDRLALAYALDSLLDDVEGDASHRRRAAGAVHERLKREDAGSASPPGPRADVEYAMPLADLLGRALLLSGAAALWTGDLEAAGVNLLGAWGQLAAGRRSEVLFARVETFEALRRTAAGRHRDAAALAERASTSFSITAHEVDAARATLAAGLAAWGETRRRDALALLRKSALGFGRPGTWSGFVTAACAAALRLLADGHVEDSRRAFRDLRRKTARKAPLADRMIVRETERIALLSARSPSKGKKARAAFTALNVVLLRGASLLGERLVAAARESEEKLEVALADLHPHPARELALLFACQKGSLLVAQDPLRALELARAIFEEAKSLMDANTEARLATPAPRETVQAEAKLVESQAQVQLGYAVESCLAAVEAREFFRAGGDVGFGMALADYYEGQAAGFARDYVAGERLLEKALRVFAEFGQDSLMGRAEAALGTLYLQRGDEQRALPYLEHAIDVLDPTEDSRHLTIALNNMGGVLARLGRFDEAKTYYARALASARRLGSVIHAQVIRTGLADLDFRRGRYERALAAYSELSRKARKAGWEEEVLFSLLYAAECLGRLGRDEEMAEFIVSVREERRKSPFGPSPAMDELFACLDQGMLDADMIAHVRSYLEDEAKGVERPFGRLKIVG